jgi:hypothetical protein
MNAVMIAVDPEMAANLIRALHSTEQVLKQCLEDNKLLRKQADAWQLLSEKQAMKYLSKSASGLQYYRSLGLPYYKKGKEIWYRKGDIDQWLQSGKVNRHELTKLPTKTKADVTEKGQ